MVHFARHGCGHFRLYLDSFIPKRTRQSFRLLCPGQPSDFLVIRYIGNKEFHVPVHRIACWSVGGRRGRLRVCLCGLQQAALWLSQRVPISPFLSAPRQWCRRFNYHEDHVARKYSLRPGQSRRRLRRPSQFPKSLLPHSVKLKDRTCSIR